MTSIDFERVLACRPCAVTEHFALHFERSVVVVSGGFSTDEHSRVVPPVDEAANQRFGQVMPKRHAKRAVTRTLLKRQGRAAWSRHAEHVAGGSIVLRLRRSYVSDRFPSAASAALRSAVRSELDTLFAAARAKWPRTVDRA